MDKYVQPVEVTCHVIIYTTAPYPIGQSLVQNKYVQIYCHFVNYNFEMYNHKFNFEPGLHLSELFIQVFKLKSKRVFIGCKLGSKYLCFYMNMNIYDSRAWFIFNA